MDNSNALHFYAKQVFPNIEDSTKLQPNTWVVIEKKNVPILLEQFPNAELKYTDRFYHVTLLSLPFLNPALREGELQSYCMYEIKK